MKIEIFTNRLFLGCFDPEDFLLSNESLAVGTIIQIADKDYCIVTISLIEPSKMFIEVC
ncbi:hypothetical protein [Bacillus atrophaeus]|uniref:Uncharacterized protein n=1 Tax=Bacillus atrophaeus (strain 1942) TaxID=720555 RepID=A0ABM5LXV8_BACA1|nr:hypothetical protein [Bacillus atrophaeus]ADP32513.1 hypothetical protein BATR1942_07870 [Bacillus atrophaeus 1942]AIK49342.1 hypothetical protein DJ95_1470 [Bacillus atrophaeus subsp. globigii]EIM11691.1 hypothetical protein UY9_05492 [Bacillus atrophaeus C89]KFK82580.1 hypothetical protein DK44_2165 [Bacillus atrophaeus]MCM3457586.1 hypothetical protein [Bacillus atrophaeus]